MGVRIDQLLHWLCLVKSRSLVARACKAGRIRVNGQEVRPAKEVRSGDHILIDDPLKRHRCEIELLELPVRQVSRREAPACYRVLQDERLGPLDGDIESS
ncbi:MAG: RNA-binding S4 domain-containing protein [Candidatus Eisenbacteria sp.]|nr:RNA-binding S4 domain-containing protein [Candidatus Eisenbacteria bacterium]